MFKTLFHSAGGGRRNVRKKEVEQAQADAIAASAAALAASEAAAEAATAIAITDAMTLVENLMGCMECGRLAYVDATHMSFKPYKGNLIRINGVVYQIPDAGIVGLANTGVYVNGVANQNLAYPVLYYIYLFNNNGVLTADFIDAAHNGHLHSPSTTAGNKGTEIKTGDDTRSLIGMVFHQAAGFADICFVSWFNRLWKARSVPGTVGGIGAAYTYLWGIYFVNWGDTAAYMNWKGYTQNGSGSAASQMLTYLYIDNAQFTGGASNNYSAVGTYQNSSICSPLFPTEGTHLAEVYGYSSAGNGYWSGDLAIMIYG